jgi:hypothetical protein
VRLQVECPRYEYPTEFVSRKDIQRSAEAIFRQSGVEKRRVGSCKACRASKHRCSRTKPSCRRCIIRKEACVYPTRRERDNKADVEEISPVSISPTGTVATASCKFQADLDCLFATDLPSDKCLLERLVRTYFDRCHYLRCLSFLHESTYMDMLQETDLHDGVDEPLLYAICALAARQLYLDAAAQGTIERSTARGVPGRAWAEKAQQMVLTKLNELSTEDLMTMVLLCDYGIRADQNAMVFILVALLFRTVLLHGLDKPKPLVNPTTEELIQRETQNRLVWACYFIDLFTATGVELNSCWHDHKPNLPLPCPEREYAIGSLSTPVFLQQVESNPSKELIQSLDLPALTLLIMSLRSRALKFIRAEPSHINVWDPTSEFRKILEQVQFIRLHLPTQYRTENLPHPLHKNRPSIGAIFLFHFLMHGVVFDLTRISLPGFNFPQAKVFHLAPVQVRSTYQDLCRVHAAEVSSLLRQGLDYGNGALDDVFCADAAVESGKIQIIYAAAVNRTVEVVRETETNLEVHLQFLNRFNQGKAGNSQYIKILLPLCAIWGFPSIAERYRDALGSDEELLAETMGELTGPADTHHLSSSNPFRKAQSQLRRRQVCSSTLSPGSPTHRSTAALRTSPGLPPNVTSFVQMSAPSTIACDIPSLLCAPESQPDRAMILAAGAETAMDATLYHFDLCQQPPLHPESITWMEPSVDQCIQAAEQMSGFLTWTSMDISPQIPFWMDTNDWPSYMWQTGS